jgi:hypothetical protein
MNTKNTFEDFIINCCKSNEWTLRDELKALLSENGFTIVEDDYVTPLNKGEQYDTIHNMLAIRGNPRVCLVAHTDVCRDYNGGAPPEVEPVIKEQFGKKIIQDKDCKTQVGGDDRLGVAINVWSAIHSKNDLALLFTTDEEAGVISASHLKLEQLKEYELLVQVDRGNRSNQLVSHISGRRLCDNNVVQRLLQISLDISLPRYEVEGFLTDVLAIKRNGMCKNAVNMTCGYHQSYGDQPDEFIDIEEAKQTLEYVSSIVDYYAAGKDLTDKFSGAEQEELPEEEEEELVSWL